MMHETNRRLNAIAANKLFSFATFADWCARAHEAWRVAGVESNATVCLDQKGRVCSERKHFIAAHEDRSFPVDVYLGVADLHSNFMLHT